MATHLYELQPVEVVAVSRVAGTWVPRRYHYQSGNPLGTYGAGVYGDLVSNVIQTKGTDADVEGTGSNVAGVPDKRIVFGFAAPDVWDSVVPLVPSTPILSVQVVAEVSTSWGATTGMAIEVGVARLGVGVAHVDTIPASPACTLDEASQTPQSYTLTAWATAPDGAAWTLDDLRHLQVAFRAGINASELFRLYRLTVKVEVRPPPEVIVDVVDDTGAATSAPADRQPRFSVDYFQYGGYPAERFEARLFASVAAPDPDVDTPVWESGQILASTADGQAYTGRIGYALSPLASGTYWLFVRASDQRARWGPWASCGFSPAGTSLTAPSAISAAAGTVPGSVNVTVTATSAVVPMKVAVERSVDGGATWAPARVTKMLGAAPTSDPVTILTATPTVLIDLDAPTGSLLYRARRIDLTGGAFVNGVFVDDLGAAITYTSTWRQLGAPFVNTVAAAVLADPESGTWVVARRRFRDLQSASEERQAALRAIGAVYPTVVADSAVGAETFQLEVRVDAAGWASLEALRSAQRPLRWVPETGLAMWVRLGPTRTETVVAARASFTSPTRWVTVQATQVAAP